MTITTERRTPRSETELALWCMEHGVRVYNDDETRFVFALFAELPLIFLDDIRPQPMPSGSVYLIAPLWPLSLTFGLSAGPALGDGWESRLDVTARAGNNRARSHSLILPESWPPSKTYSRIACTLIVHATKFRAFLARFSETAADPRRAIHTTLPRELAAYK